jgi:DNA-binding SARP family transcriptional activator/tetratricopeptide (TPR) repeat protein
LILGDKLTVQQRLHLLGPVRVEQLVNPKSETADKEAPIKIRQDSLRFRSRRTIALLGYLAAERRPVARSFLAALFWPDDELSTGRGNLRRELHNLGNVLPNCWQQDRHAVEFTPSVNTDVDIYTLLDLETRENWTEAADRFGGEFLEGLYLDNNIEFENWLASERDRWRWRTEMILTRVIESHTRRGQYRIAIQYSMRLLQVAPWKEEIHQRVMRLLTWTGQRGTALRQFESCQQTLINELGVEPSDETITLFRQIQAGELDLPPQIPAFLTEELPKRDPIQTPIVARDEELEQLNASLDSALAGQGSIVFITGGPGRGKTVLMEAFARQAMEDHPSLLVASGNCNAFYGIGDPYLPFKDIMSLLTGEIEAKWDAGRISREHARGLWEAFPVVAEALLDDAPNIAGILVQSSTLLERASIFELTSSFGRFAQLKELINRQQIRSENDDVSQLYQQTTNMLQTIARQHPLLLILDDLQWVDMASISLLFHLGRRLAVSDSRILILCAFRPEEISSGREEERHPFVKLINEFKRTVGNQWLDLTYLEESEKRRFVDAILDTEPNKLPEQFRTALIKRTGGHPFFTVELLHSMQERGNLIKDRQGDWVAAPGIDWNMLPTRIEAVIEERIQRLDPQLQDTLAIASVEGEIFTAEVVADIQGVSERPLLRQLSIELEQQHRLVREQEQLEIGHKHFSRYKFRHILFRDFLYGRISPGEKRLLHASTANAIEKLFEGQLDEIAVQLANHLHEAGEYNRSFKYYIRAAERAASIYANDEASTLYSQAIELAELASPDVALLTELHRGRGLASETLGKFEQAHLDHTTALQLARTTGEHLAEWRALIDLGKLWRSRDYNKARACLETALKLARQMGDPEVLANSLNWIGNWNANVDRPQAAVMYHQEALALVEKLNTPQELANTLDLLGIASLLGGDTVASVKYYNRAISLFRELDDRARLITCLLGRVSNFFLLAMSASISPTESREPILDLNEALKIAIEINSAPDQAWVYWASGQLHTRNGQFGYALEELQKGIRIASEIEHREFVVTNRFGMGELYNEMLTPEIALVQLKESLSLAKELHSQNLINDITGALAKAYILLKDYEEAQSCLDVVLSSKTPMDTLSIRYCWTRQGELALARGNPELALDILDRLIASAPGINPEDVITFLWMLKGKSLTRLGLYDQAASFLTAAIDNANKSGERTLLWRAHANLGRLYLTIDNPDAAERELLASKSIVEEITATIPDELIMEKFSSGAYDILSLKKENVC